MRTPIRLGWTLAPAAILLAGCGPKAAPPPPPPAVKVATVLQQDVPVHLETIGEARGNTEIEIRARVAGFLQTVDFQEGSLVSKGQRLCTIDPALFEAPLAQARGGLAEAEAQLARARRDVVRYGPLVAKNAISRQEYETAVAIERAAVAGVDAAEATVERARIQLGYAKVLAPADGLVGRTEVYAGTLVGQGNTTLLTRISQIDPIHVRFSLPEKDDLYYFRRREELKQNAGDMPQLPFRLMLADGSTLPGEGRPVFVDRAVDPTTGTIMLEAAFPNPDFMVRPGPYGRVRATASVKPGAILVPQRAVSEMQGVYRVATVKADDTVEMRIVTPAERIGSLWVIDSGLQPGDRVVVEGVQKARPGIKVAPETVTIGEGTTPAAAPGAAGSERTSATFSGCDAWPPGTWSSLRVRDS